MAWSDMEPKQKGMLVAVIIIFIIIGYMVYKLFFADSSITPSPPAAAPVVAKAAPPATPPATAAVANNTNNAGADLAVADNTQAGMTANGAQSAAGADAVPQVVEMPKRELTPEELALLEERRQVQQQYLQLVNQYQLMEMQNKVATSQSSLVKTQIETAKSEQQASKLGLVLPGGQAQDDNTDKSLKGVVLVYVGQKDGVWNAVLNLRGNYVTVKLGSRLPDDSLISKINETSVVLYKDGERRTLMVPMVVDHDMSDDDDTNTDSASNNGGANTSSDNASSNNTSSNNTGN